VVVQVQPVTPAALASRQKGQQTLTFFYDNTAHKRKTDGSHANGVVVQVWLCGLVFIFKLMNHYVDILQSQKTKRYYTGMSASPDQRLHFHNQGLNASTKNGVPWLRVWLCQKLSKSEALKLERKVKKRGAARFLQD
jgi:putative endonuclease